MVFQPCPWASLESILSAEAAHARNCVSPALQLLQLRQVPSGLDHEARTLKRSCSPPTVSDEIISQANNHVTCSVVDLGVHIMIASFPLAVRQDALCSPYVVPHRTRRGTRVPRARLIPSDGGCHVVLYGKQPQYIQGVVACFL